MKFVLYSLVMVFSCLSALGQSTETARESQIDSLIALMTLEEKVAMCHAQSKFSSPGVPRLGIPEIWMSDGPHGVRAEINWDNWGYAGWTNDSITAFPALTALASTFNPELSAAYGVAVGEEARYRKKDILLGPGVNIYRTPLNGRNFEYMGEDPYLASQMVVPYIQGVQQNGVAACVKHYALNNQELWRGHINVHVSDRALHEIYLPAFKAAVVEGEAWSIMGAYNQFRGQHCCHNELLLNDILKTDWGFDGVVVTDWGGAHDTKQAAEYGLDIEMGTWTNGLTASKALAYDNYFLASPFLNQIKAGDLSEDLVDDKVRRILRLMYRTSMDATKPLGRVNNAAHHAVARQVATEGIVLLKNEGDFFPIDPNQKLKIAVIGENATRQMTLGGGSSELKAQFEISPLQGLRERYREAEIVHSMGYASGAPAYGRALPSPYDADSLKAAALAVAKDADVVLFFGGLNKNHYQDCEGGDRLQYGLPFGQDELLHELAAVNANLGLVLISGNAVAMPWLPKVKGVMQGWYLGSMAGYALADVISGDVNPSGKMPFSIPKELKDNAAHSFGEMSYPGDSIDQYYKEDILVGYRWHDTKKVTPQYAFGYGLSYTDFAVSAITTDRTKYSLTDEITVSYAVANTGKTAGAEVVQVYVGKPKSKVNRAKKELKGFDKITVEAGQSATGSLTIPVSDLAYYDEKSSDWKVESGSYVLYIGNASDQIQREIKVQIK
ncbi:glycoside hydrolase family 3 C-terminal domain-containing protein [Reichenbachiella sp. MSK19-1]|uniref:glycoside hydrolase family 3 C-terminal domain-containing protein n=1 Tax=Reichenbachiella sp. MSK19-1 TaxID=1897631 RepID=UPI000E6BB7BD|nr:glycoside hydrolase family 3 C-terminal domain-containing protein [Reichenbachiella sp. MSK19-1]RJE72697.1 glycosyl hydrolase [Reichenbachiella sp. MSK19-1]